jgi:hypothetical protein
MVKWSIPFLLATSVAVIFLSRTSHLCGNVWAVLPEIFLNDTLLIICKFVNSSVQPARAARSASQVHITLLIDFSNRRYELKIFNNFIIESLFICLLIH